VKIEEDAIMVKEEGNEKVRIPFDRLIAKENVEKPRA